MSFGTLLFATATMAISFGWQKADDGYEYLVQLEPETLRLMNDGIDVPIDSHVPEGVQPIRRIRIVVGKAELPRDVIADADSARSDEGVERTAFWRPGDPTPPPAGVDGRYPTAPPAAPPVTMDTLVQPLRTADNYVEQGFEAGVKGLDNTGKAIQNAVGNASDTVQEQFQRGKEYLVGPSPGTGIPATSPTASTANGAGTTSTYGALPTWPAASPTTTSGTGGSIPNLPPPPLAGTGTPTATASPTSPPTGAAPTTPNAWDYQGPQIPDNRTTTTVAAPTNTGSRLVPVDQSSTTSPPANVPQWDPKWADTSTTTTTGFSEQWPAPPTSATPSTTSTTPQPVTANLPTSTPPAATPPPATADNTAASNAQSMGNWMLAMIALVASVAANCFLGLNYLDIRNKYRAALRRTSRSFGRAPAGA
jgi:hypothetical protein